MEKKVNLNPFFIPYTKVNSKWMTVLNINAKIINFLKESIGENLYNHWNKQKFLRLNTKVQPQKKNN